MNQQQSTWSRTAAPGEVIYSEGYVGSAVIYVITDGKVEISARSDDKKVVLATLGKGEFFGEAALLPAEPRGSTAKALTYCHLTVIEASLVEAEIARVSPLLRHLVRTMVRRVKKKDDLLATYTRSDFLPSVVSYAHVLALMGAVAQGYGWEGRARVPQSPEARVSLADVIKKFHAMAGHSRVHVMAMLKRMEKLNLVTLSTGSAELVTFDPARIAERSQLVADQEFDLSVANELELIELIDLETLIGVEKDLLLNKLSHGEIAEDVFAFRKAKVLTYVQEKGITYFSKRNVRPRGEVNSLEDLQFVDQRTLFEAVSTVDTYDLAKLLTAVTSQAVADLLLSVMTEARRKEVSWVMRRDIKINPDEVEAIGQRLLDMVKAMKSSAASAGVFAKQEA